MVDTANGGSLIGESIDADGPPGLFCLNRNIDRFNVSSLLCKAIGRKMVRDDAGDIHTADIEPFIDRLSRKLRFGWVIGGCPDGPELTIDDCAILKRVTGDCTESEVVYPVCSKPPATTPPASIDHPGGMLKSSNGYSEICTLMCLTKHT